MNDHIETIFQCFTPLLYVLSIVLVFFSLVTLYSILNDNNMRSTPSTILIANLALVDLGLACFTLTNNVLRSMDVQTYTSVLCEIKTSLYVMVCTLSLLFTFTNSVDRYIYIRFSMRYHQIVTLSRTKKIVAFIWIFSVLFGAYPSVVGLILGKGCNTFKISALWLYGGVVPLMCLYGLCSVIIQCMYISLFRVVRKKQRRSDYALNFSRSKLPVIGDKDSSSIRKSSPIVTVSTNTTCISVPTSGELVREEVEENEFNLNVPFVDDANNISNSKISFEEAEQKPTSEHIAALERYPLLIQVKPIESDTKWDSNQARTLNQEDRLTKTLAINEHYAKQHRPTISSNQSDHSIEMTDTISSSAQERTDTVETIRTINADPRDKINTKSISKSSNNLNTMLSNLAVNLSDSNTMFSNSCANLTNPSTMNNENGKNSFNTNSGQTVDIDLPRSYKNVDDQTATSSSYFNHNTYRNSRKDNPSLDRDFNSISSSMNSTPKDYLISPTNNHENDRNSSKKTSPKNWKKLSKMFCLFDSQKRKPCYSQRDLRTAKLLFILLGVYILLWSPSYAVLFFRSFYDVPVEYFMISYVLVIVNSIINFFVYPMRVARIRNAFLKSLKNSCSCCLSDLNTTPASSNERSQR